MSASLVDAANLRQILKEFSALRDWDQFHSPKNLAIALSIEAAELLEPFQWLTPEQSSAAELGSDQVARVAEELADVLIYLVRLADVLGVDLNQAVTEKLAANAEKYPVDKVKGSAAKYTEYTK